MSETWQGSPWCAGSLNGQQAHGGDFPLVLTPGNDQGQTLSTLTQDLAACREQLLDAAGRQGAILFRGFPLRTAEDFDAFVQAFALPNFAYNQSLSNALRHNRTERVFTANEAPPEVEIYLHHEMAQTPDYPSRLFFFCEKAATAGGATPLCRSDVVLERIAQELPEFLAALRELGACYTNVMPARSDTRSGQGRSWQDTLNADDPEAAERRLEALGYHWEWRDDNSLRVTTAALPAVRQTSDGREVFFNQLIAAFCGWQDARNQARKSITLGDGSDIPEQAMARAAALAYELVFDVVWQDGDVALVDNFLVMHGRRPFQGQRRVLAALTH